jgi:chitodextrinase/predicted esterase
MKKNLLFTAVLSLCVLASVLSQNVFDPNDQIVNFNSSNTPAAPPPNTLAKWGRTPNSNLPNPFDTDNFKAYYYNGMAFRLRYPNNYNPANATKYPVILFFHGIGETGPATDNEYHLSWGAKEFESKINAGQFNAFLLFPQTSIGDWAYSFDNVNNVLDLMQEYCNTDPDRLITMGLSLGGDGTMKYTFDYPQRSAISIPASSGSIGDFTQDPSLFIHVPFWIASGGQDAEFANPQRVQAFVNNFTSYGGDIRWTYYPDRGHGTWPFIWDEPYLIPYWQNAHKANPLVFNKQTDFPAKTPFTVKIGITPGYAEYQWQRDGADIGNITNDITVSQPGTYRVRFRRVSGGIWSDWSPNPAVITQPDGTDYTLPSVPDNLRIVSSTTTSVTLDWDNSTDNVGVTGYDVFVNGVKKYSTTNSDIVADNLNAATTYSFTVQAYDAANNLSAFSSAVNGTTATPADVTVLSAPANVRVVSTTTTSITLDWDNSTDNVGVTGYDIFVNGVKKYSNSSSEIDADNLNPATSYSFTVQAHDLENNFSAFSSAVNGTTDSVPPPAENSITRQLIPNRAFTLTSSENYDISISQTKNTLHQTEESLTPGLGNFVTKQIYPNPFSGSFTINFYNASPASKISIDLLDVSGRLLYKQYFGNINAGNTSLKVDANRQAHLPGVYLVRMMVNGVPSKLMKLVKK